MKKILKIVALMLALTLCLGMTTFAEEVQADDSNTLAEIYGQNGATATFVVNDKGEKTEQITVTYTDANNIKDGQFYLVVVLAGDEEAVPTEDNILYMDQTVAVGNSVAFSVYASDVAGKIEDSIILIYGTDINPEGESTNTLIAAIIKALYILGDVDDSGSVTMQDAMQTARYAMGMTVTSSFVEAAAKVKTGSVTMQNAMLIARYAMKMISVFPIEE